MVVKSGSNKFKKSKMKFSAIFFLVLMVFVPTLAHADIFAQLSQNGAQGCGLSTGFVIQCSKNYDDGLFSAISCKVMTVFNRGVVPMYCQIVTSAEYISAIHALMTLFVIIWGVTFLIGNVATTTGTAMVNLFKLTFVYFFCLNSDIFFDFIYPTVLAFPAELVGLILGSIGESKDFFAYVDQHFTMVFKETFYPQLQDGATSKKADIRLFVLGIAVGKLVPGGGFITGLFFMVISGWLMAYINIMVRYLVSIMALIFLLMLTPIFLPAKLFKALDFLFDEWVKMIISFSIQIVVVVTFLIMIEPFFLQFIDLIKLGFNNIVLENGYVPELVGQGKTVDGDGVEAVYQHSGPTMATSEKYVTQLDISKIKVDGQPLKKEDFVPWFMFALLQAAIAIYLTYTFMKEVPKFAALIAGNPKFIAIAQTPTDSSFGSPQKAVGMPHERGLEKLRSQVGKAFKADDAPAPKPDAPSPASGRGDASKKQGETQEGINFENKY